MLLALTEETLSLDIETQSLLTLTAINAGKLQQQSAVENSFVSEVVSNSALPLGKGLWVTDAVSGNVKNAWHSVVRKPFLIIMAKR